MKFFCFCFILFLTGCTDKTLEENGFLKGSVKSVNGNSPIAGVLVQCEGNTFTTGSNGFYQIENIPVGSRQLIATKTDFEIYSKTVTIKLNGTTEDISMVSNIVGASVYGYIKHTDGTPINNASVNIAGMTDNTDATGRYQLPSIPQGTQNVQVTANGYETYNQTFYMYSSDKQININLRKYYDKVFFIDKDTYVSNLGSTASGVEGLIFATNCLQYAKSLYLHSNITIPNNSEITKIEIVFTNFGEIGVNPWNWLIATISESWSEYNMSNANEPRFSANYSAPYVKNESNVLYLNIKNAYDKNGSNFFQNGFRMIPIYNEVFTNWNGFMIYSRESNEESRRPKLVISYLY